MWGNQEQASFQQGQGEQQGGYLNSPGAQFNSSQQLQQRAKRSQNVLPCTVAQLLAAEQDGDRFVTTNKLELHQVTMVGLVRTVSESNTKLDYQLDDMTAAPFQVLQFVDNDENTPEEERTPPMKENTYIRVYGHLRSFNNKRNVVAFRVLPITDMNELTTHLLETVHGHMYMDKARTSSLPGVSGAAPVASGGGDHQQGGGQAQGGSYAGAQPDQGLTQIQGQVQAVIRSCMDEEGVSIKFIAQRLQGIPERALREAVEFLSGEGHIYSTIDDDHYKSTDSG